MHINTIYKYKIYIIWLWLHSKYIVYNIYCIRQRSEKQHICRVLVQRQTQTETEEIHDGRQLR